MTRVRRLLVPLALLAFASAAPAGDPQPPAQSQAPATPPSKPSTGPDRATPAPAADGSKAERPATPPGGKQTSTPQRFEPSEKVRPDFDVAFPVDI